jgi:hypothetical protein
MTVTIACLAYIVGAWVIYVDARRRVKEAERERDEAKRERDSISAEYRRFLDERQAELEKELALTKPEPWASIEAELAAAGLLRGES